MTSEFQISTMWNILNYQLTYINQGPSLNLKNKIQKSLGRLYTHFQNSKIGKSWCIHSCIRYIVRSLYRDQGYMRIQEFSIIMNIWHIGKHPTEVKRHHEYSRHHSYGPYADPPRSVSGGLESGRVATGILVYIYICIY